MSEPHGVVQVTSPALVEAINWQPTQNSTNVLGPELATFPHSIHVNDSVNASRNDNNEVHANIMNDGFDGSVNDDHEEGDDRDDDDDSSGEDDGEDGIPFATPNPISGQRWQAIEEDISTPCDDEMVYIDSKPEISALDHLYWQGEVFFALEDVEFKPIESGRIDWLIEHFNGTKEEPNTQTIMRSDVVRIAGLDWRIKFFPRGDNTDFLSVYVECVSMQSEDFGEFEDFEHLPLPQIQAVNEKPLRKRRSIAAQVGVVMYNPAEPRVNHHHNDAIQFNKSTSDFGWRYFSGDSYNVFHLRQHGQRQAILRDDKLAFSAYIRVVSDPTGCLWIRRSEHDKHGLSVMTTGLRPFPHQWPQIAALVPLCHFAPFRKLILESRSSAGLVRFLQSMLVTMMSRARTTSTKAPVEAVANDAVMILRRLSRQLSPEFVDPGAVSDLIGSIDPNKGSCIGQNRLVTKHSCSVAEALARRTESTPLETPPLLTLELNRREFDRTSRKWKILDNYVGLDEEIVVGDHGYTLWAFGTHLGVLTSNQHRVYVRPKGPGSNWCAYGDGKVQAMTNAQVMDSRCGIKAQESDTLGKTPTSTAKKSSDTSELAYVVYYVRNDHGPSAFASPRTESWRDSFADHYRGKDIIWENDSAVIEADLCPGQDDIPSTHTIFLDANDTCESSSPTEGEQDAIMSDVASDGTLIGDAASSGELHVPLEPFGSVKMVVDALGRDYYEGEMIGLKRDVRGRWIQPNGEEYTGSFNDSPDREYHVEGEMVRLKRHGQGHWIQTNGDEYVGSFYDDQAHGEGKMTYSQSGDVYEGSWVDGKRHGRGRLIEAATGNVYTGGWKHDCRHGSFVLEGNVAEEEREVCTICYERELNTAFYDCGHVIACRECANRIVDCPVCRKAVLARLQLYGIRMRIV